MDGNPEGTISSEEAFVQMMTAETPEQTSDETDEGEAEPEALEGQSGEVEAEADDGAEAEPGESDDDPEFEIETVNGKERKRLSELVEGNMLRADYTRKTMALAEDRKATERAKAELVEQQGQLAEALKVWAVPVDQEPDWQALARQVPPQEFNLRRVDWEQRQRKAAAAREQFHALQSHQRQERMQTEHARMLEVIPEWRDEAKFKAAAPNLVQVAQKYGYSAEEAGAMDDHRQVLILKALAEYDAIKQGNPAVTKKVTPTGVKLKPAAPTNKATEADARRNAARAQLAKKGDEDSFVSFLLSG